MSHAPGPGDSITPDLPPARLPHLEHIYRFVADMGADPIEAPNMRGTGQTISAANMARGVVVGPRVNGRVLDNSGADLATRIDSDKAASCIPCTTHPLLTSSSLT